VEIFVHLSSLVNSKINRFEYKAIRKCMDVQVLPKQCLHR